MRSTFRHTRSRRKRIGRKEGKKKGADYIWARGRYIA